MNLDREIEELIVFFRVFDYESIKALIPKLLECVAPFTSENHFVSTLQYSLARGSNNRMWIEV